MEVRGQLYSRRAPGTRWTGGWVGPTVGLDAVAKRNPCPCRESNPCPQASSLVTNFGRVTSYYALGFLFSLFFPGDAGAVN